ncbi:MAG: WYL domain-containing protein [Proteobacteria bacterium]|nr:WYL domain-containing protein [Pseudomonadota bacterium]
MSHRTSSDYSNLCNLRNLWIKKADGKIRLIFSSSSESELTGWALSFADEAKVIKPKWLVEKVSQTIKRMEKAYS